MKNLIIFLICYLTGFILCAQVAVNTDGSSPDPSAMLDVKSSAGGILIPRVALTSATDATTISSPAPSLLVYNTGTGGLTPAGFYYNAGTDTSPLWKKLFTGTAGAEPWTTKGNSGTTPGTDFMGTTDNQAFDIRTNNTVRLRITTKGQLETLNTGQSVFIGEQAGANDDLTEKHNTFIGYAAGKSNSNGWDNIAIGYQALFSNISGVENTAVGMYSLYHTTKQGNTAVGWKALYANTTGVENTAVGELALAANTTACQNTATGYAALRDNIDGEGNTACGCASLLLNTHGNYNTTCGYAALFKNTTGSWNTANGHWALENNQSGNSNVAVGVAALFMNTDKSNLVAIGDSALYNNGDGASSQEAAGNTAVGSKALYSNKKGSLSTATGCLSLYNLTSGQGNVAVGYTALYNLTSGDNNTCVGYACYPYGTTTYSNYTGIGYYTGTNIADPSNRVEIGNTSVGWIGGQVGWSTYSDERIKEKIREDVPGLDFIMRLKPVTYNLNIHKENEMVYGDKAKQMDDWPGKYDIEKKRMTGFLAQQVEQAAEEANYEFSGIEIPKDGKGLYSLQYSAFIVPLVKAVQEQQQMIEKQQKIIEKLQAEVRALLEEN